MPKIATVLFILFLCGCGSTSLKRVEQVSFEGLDPQAARAKFSQSLPQSFELVNSIVFAYSHMKLSCLGPIQVDTLKRNFSVAGLNYVGMKLFELGFDEGRVDTKYIFPELSKHGDFAMAVSEDIQRIYFDRIPAAGSSVTQKGDKIIFRQSEDSGFLEYVFSNRDGFLLEKSFYLNKRKLWSVLYSDYIVNKEKLFPAHIVLRHNSYKYYLVIRLKEIRQGE